MVLLTFVIHIFVPLRIYPPSEALAVTFMLTTSEPAECSDMANAPTFWPEIRPGSSRAFCSSDPLSINWLMQSCECAAYDNPMLPYSIRLSDHIVSLLLFISLLIMVTRHTWSSTDFFHHDAMCLVSHSETSIILVRSDTQKPVRITLSTWSIRHSNLICITLLHRVSSTFR